MLRNISNCTNLQGMKGKPIVMLHILHLEKSPWDLFKSWLMAQTLVFCDTIVSQGCCIWQILQLFHNHFFWNKIKLNSYIDICLSEGWNHIPMHRRETAFCSSLSRSMLLSSCVFICTHFPASNHWTPHLLDTLISPLSASCQQNEDNFFLLCHRNENSNIII